jgi:hypothetical protein
MHPGTRAALARLVYLRALAAARLAPTPRRWRKLVAAAKRLRAAERARERQRLAALSPSARALAGGRRSDVRGDAVLLPFPGRPR